MPSYFDSSESFPEDLYKIGFNIVDYSHDRHGIVQVLFFPQEFVEQFD